MIRQAAAIVRRLRGKRARDYLVRLRKVAFLWLVRATVILGGREAPERWLWRVRSSARQPEIGWGELTRGGSLLWPKPGVLRSRLAKLEQSTPATLRKFMRLADDAFARRGELLGSGIVSLAVPGDVTGIRGLEVSRTVETQNGIIDWMLDYRSGYRWSAAAWYSDSLDYVSTEGADIKLPWELSRCHHMPILALACFWTRDTKYGDEVLTQIEDWIASNGYCRGPNWACTMDVAIRLANWLITIDLLKAADYPFPISGGIYRNLVLHVIFIENNLEWTSALTSNHYLSDITGLYFGAVYVPSLRHAKSLREFVEKELNIEIAKQLRDDGMNAEASTGYHGLVTQLFAYSALLARAAGADFSRKYLDRLRTALDVQRLLQRPDGSTVLIGDNDSGSFVRFSNASERGKALGALLTQAEDVVDGCVFEPLGPWTKATSTCTALRESGLFIYRRPELGMHLVIHNGPNGQRGNGGHCHNDRLSVTLSWAGRNVLEDPGSGAYTSFPRLRDEQRSTSVHNTVQVESHEQNRFRGAFSMCEDVRVRHNELVETHTGFSFFGSHDGYTRLAAGLVHRRYVVFDDRARELRIDDEFDDVDYDKVAGFCMLSENLCVSDDRVESPFFSAHFVGADRVAIEPALISAGYGDFDDEQYVRVLVSFRQSLKTRFELR